ncbi:PQQ-binding-like beta-propeller repeat protein [Methanosarcina horonobensis]|uniref:PQQ-binding-like beta-propeller repeat protein n=1 Tax=Methanosarcina horonobensis TaxID=418008 RepID=UPI000A5B68B7|nr:PQQ-binding-like beta-propeller repeat protein [Methanosarcina horonobensis]
MKKNLIYVILFLFASLFVFASVASATEIVLDTEYHHLGDDFKEELNPDDPEGLIYTTIFTLDPSVDIESAELTLTGRSVVPGPTDEFLDKVYLNNIEIGSLNDYVQTETSDSAAVNITIPVHFSYFNSGNNTIKISAGSNANGSNYDDFEFSNLSLYLSETEPVTLTPPLKVAWTYKLPWEFGCEKPAVKILAVDGILYICEEYEENIIALDAETGEQLWNKESSADLAYKNGILYAVCPSKIDALDAKTGELLWSRESPDIWWENPLIFGKTLFVSTPYEMRIAAIDIENGNLRWEQELENSMSDLVVNEDFVVISNYLGLIALDTKTGEEVWRYTDLSEYSYSPFLYKDMVYIKGKGDIIALFAESGENIWKKNIGEWASIVEIKK